jgi:acetyltransferase-like isoleucine patch superfamily enzyme
MHYSNKELIDLGFKKIGKNCKISNKIFIYSNNIEIGDNVRIDDLVTLKGKIVLKDNIHLAKGCTLSGGNKGIFIDDFSAISNFVQFFTISDDYVSPNIPVTTLNKIAIKKFSKIYNKGIYIGKNVLIGSMSVILPGAIVGDYSSIGAFSVIHEKIEKGLYYSNHNKIVNKKRDIAIMKAKMIKVKKYLKSIYLQKKFNN